MAQTGEPVEEPIDPEVLAGLRFTDVTDSAGLGMPHGVPSDALDGDVFAGGAAAEDYDGDGDIDLYLTSSGLPNLLYRNDGDGTFTDVAASAGVEAHADRGGDGAPVWADIDGDADLDLLVTSALGSRTLLYVNDGTGSFTDEAQERGLYTPDPDPAFSQNFGATFADIDLDGDLDLFVARWATEWLEGEQPYGGDPGDAGDVDRSDLCDLDPGQGATGDTYRTSALYLNDGTGVFSDGTGAWGLDLDSVAAFQPTFADFDNDRWPDLFLTGDFCTSRLYRNDQGQGFVDITESAGVGTAENAKGSVVADLDGDGSLDWFVTSTAHPTAGGGCPDLGGLIGCSGNRVYAQTGPGSFEDATDEFGLRDGYWGWGAAAADLNNDGHVDIAQTNGFFDSTDYFVTDPTTIWVNPGTLPLLRATEQVGLEDRRGRQGADHPRLRRRRRPRPARRQLRCPAPPVAQRDAARQRTDRHPAPRSRGCRSAGNRGSGGGRPGRRRSTRERGPGRRVLPGQRPHRHPHRCRGGCGTGVVQGDRLLAGRGHAADDRGHRRHRGDDRAGAAEGVIRLRFCQRFGLITFTCDAIASGRVNDLDARCASVGHTSTVR